MRMAERLVHAVVRGRVAGMVWHDRTQQVAGRERAQAKSERQGKGRHGRAFASMAPQRILAVQVEPAGMAISLAPAGAAKELLGLVPDTDTAEYRKVLGQQMVQSFAAEGDARRKYAAQYFTSERGQEVFTQGWTPAGDIEMKGVLLLIHGLNEHGGRYDAFARALNLRGYGVFCIDWIGHGCSDGLHGYVDRLAHVIADTAYLSMLRHEYPGLPYFLFGHSTGGAIALKVALQTHHECPLAGIVLTSPAIQIEGQDNIMALAAPLISSLFPTFQLPPGPKSASKVSHDPYALEAKYGDPLVYTKGLRVRTGWEIVSLARDLRKELDDVDVPFLVMHGTSDNITEPSGSQELHRRAKSTHKSLKLYQSLLHDLLFEYEKDDITNDVLEWLDERLKGVAL